MPEFDDFDLVLVTSRHLFYYHWLSGWYPPISGRQIRQNLYGLVCAIRSQRSFVRAYCASILRVRRDRIIVIVVGWWTEPWRGTRLLTCPMRQYHAHHDDLIFCSIKTLDSPGNYFGSPAALGSVEGRSVASRMKRGPVAFHPRLSGGFGFIVVARDLSIVAGWQIGSRLPMSALGGDLKRSTQHFN